jgi:hypothetical protein
VSGTALAYCCPGCTKFDKVQDRKGIYIGTWVLKICTYLGNDDQALHDHVLIGPELATVAMRNMSAYGWKRHYTWGYEHLGLGSLPSEAF